MEPNVKEKSARRNQVLHPGSEHRRRGESVDPWGCCRGLGLALSLSRMQWTRAYVQVLFQLLPEQVKNEDDEYTMDSCRTCFQQTDE